MGALAKKAAIQSFKQHMYMQTLNTHQTKAVAISTQVSVANDICIWGGIGIGNEAILGVYSMAETNTQVFCG